MPIGCTKRPAVTKIDQTHDPRATSWVASADGHSQFPVQNLALGVFAQGEERLRIGTAIGDHVLDLATLAEAGHLPESLISALQSDRLNALFELPGDARLALRHALFAMLTSAIWRSRLQP